MKILIFGSTGMLGRYVTCILSDIYNVICCNRQEFDIITDNWNKLYDVTENLTSGDIIINCAGTIPQKYNPDNLIAYIRVNSIFPHKLSEIAKNKTLNFIHITTDCVYSGMKGNYRPYDKPDTKNIYGISKYLGEPEDAMIIRTSIIGEEITGKKSLLEWVLQNSNGAIKGFNNHIWNGVTCLSLAELIYTIIKESGYWKGVRHIFSPRHVSKYELCCIINEIYNLHIEIENTQDIVSKNMTLTDSTSFIKDDIYVQIQNQKNFKGLKE